MKFRTQSGIGHRLLFISEKLFNKIEIKECESKAIILYANEC